ncbi:acyltransferase family protein [Nubsella zeaxanthinifaciens]|uniref:acyltransferase family protein n=1 Tax=Nubsella zeaxanthinifaciens TaxID=392412 RepID=UPI003CFD906A
MISLEAHRGNNFHLIRLLAAIQVVILHHFEHFQINQISYASVEKLIWNFPGVNVFFIVSGYLIFQSAERNTISDFFQKRVRRIYPALFVCFFITVALLLVFKCLSQNELFSKDFIVWLAAQTTFFQFYNPDIVRDFGFSPPNGALWTISVELQFYVFVSLFWYFILKRLSSLNRNLVLIMLFIFSAAFNFYYNNHFHPESLSYKLSFVFVLSYLYLFIAGALVYFNRSLILPKLKGRAAYWIVIFILVSLFLNHFQIRYHRYAFNGLSFCMLLILVALIFSVAYTKTNFSDRLFKGNDFSYGIYLYQMLVLNTFFQIKSNNSLLSLVLSFSICLVMGVLSWFIVEKRFLKPTIRA